MCIAIPGRLVEISEDGDMRLGTVEFEGLSRTVSLDLLPEAEVGDYVLVYTGFAMARVDEAEAQALLQLHAEMAELVGLED